MDGLFNNDSHMNNNFQFDFHMNYQNSLFMEQQNQHQYQQQQISPDGSSSPSSFMCLSKPSYENNNSSDFEGSGSDRLHDNEGEDPNHKLPKIMKRAIYKNYEPISDNGVTYNYHDDPSEYKKARKRVQNRVSATRIRGKNKNFVEELKVEVDDLRDEITALKTKNNVLTSENALLKQQITFMERLLMGGAGKAAAAPEISLEQETKLDIHPVNQHKNNVEKTVNNKQEVASYSRAAPSSSRLKKHTAFLGMLTVLLCISSILTQGAQARGIMHALTSNTQVNFFMRPFYNSNAPAMRTELNINHTDNPNGIVKVEPSPWASWASIAIIGIETLFIGIYVFYAIYVFTLAHQKYVNDKEKQEKK